jgi:hypothetical protein
MKVKKLAKLLSQCLDLTAKSRTDKRKPGKCMTRTVPKDPDKPARRVKGNGRDHWMPVDAKDWLTDECLSECSDATQGIWMRMLLVMWINEGYELVGTISKLALKIGRPIEGVKPAVIELAETGTADVFVVENGIAKPWPPHGQPIATPIAEAWPDDSQKSVVIVRSRRLCKERGRSNLLSEWGRKGAAKRWGKGDSQAVASSFMPLPLTSPSPGPGPVREGLVPASPGNRNCLVPVPVGSDLEDDNQPF